MTHPLITAALAMPNTHQCVTKYSDGTTRSHRTRSEQTAENYAILERRKIGRNLTDRATGKSVCVVSVEVLKIKD